MGTVYRAIVEHVVTDDAEPSALLLASLELGKAYEIVDALSGSVDEPPPPAAAVELVRMHRAVGEWREVWSGPPRLFLAGLLRASKRAIYWDGAADPSWVAAEQYVSVFVAPCRWRVLVTLIADQ